MRPAFRFLLLAAVLATANGLSAAERIPPAPKRYFNDYAGVVSSATAGALDRQLESYERESSNQLLVAIYQRMDSVSSVEDYTVRVAQAWQVGQKAKNNGAVLFVFKDDRQIYLQVGYGLEATLTDARAHDIVENILKPRFRSGNFDAGLREAVSAMIAATKGEYRGTGRTNAGARADTVNLPGGVVVALIVFAILLSIGRARLRGTLIQGRRRGPGVIFWGGGGGSGGRGGSGGGFSGGGGSFGGGGAGGKW